MKTILFLLGTRPEVIKLAPIIQHMKQGNTFRPVVCATAQHRSMQDQMLKRFSITPNFDLDIMKHGQDLYYLTETLMHRLKPIYADIKPDFVITQGDTTTTFVGSLSAFYAKIPVGHVEAGLRSFQPYSPFPEEMNRSLASRLATVHFAPTPIAKQNLLAENIQEKAIHITGNTVIDALLWMQKNLDAEHILSSLPPEISHLIQTKTPYLLITAHRRESFGQGFQSICDAIKTLAEKYPHYHFIFPVHLNPNVRKPVFETLAHQKNISLIEPANYETFIYLMTHCTLMLTDSGGVQEEAPALGKPVLVMRETTERPEGVAAGTAKLVGTKKADIVTAAAHLIDDKAAYDEMANAINPYGDGTAAQKIIDILTHELQDR
jgi:UDP-N-acetylglucosamine 2-epimerase (non-hydrolysing)